MLKGTMLSHQPSYSPIWPLDDGDLGCRTCPLIAIHLCVPFRTHHAPYSTCSTSTNTTANPRQSHLNFPTFPARQRIHQQPPVIVTSNESCFGVPSYEQLIRRHLGHSHHTTSRQYGNSLLCFLVSVRRDLLLSFAELEIASRLLLFAVC